MGGKYTVIYVCPPRTRLPSLARLGLLTVADIKDDVAVTRTVETLENDGATRECC